jgi:hypothetical protein
MSDQASEIYLRLADSILQRYQRSQQKTIMDVYQVDPEFLKVDSESLEFIITNRDGIISVLENPQLSANLLDLFVEEAIRYTYERNQFIHLDDQEKQVFTAIYQDYLKGIREIIAASPDLERLEKNLSQLIENHFRRLSKNITRFFDPQADQNIQENLILKKAICSEYSPDLQMEILGINLKTLKEPVLDIGCGQSGKLVKYLNSNGIDAYGVDRLTDQDNKLIQSDWFDMPLLPESWGTILSHMAFSNHFHFHHRYQNGQPETYARIYIKILQSLKHGGAFHYSPGLPFIEQFLPPEVYRVKRMRLDLANKNQLHTLQSFEDDTWYVAKITKI